MVGEKTQKGYQAVADPEGRPPTPLFLDETEGPKKGPKKNVWRLVPPPPPPLSKGLDDRPHPISQGLDPALTSAFYVCEKASKRSGFVIYSYI